MTQAIAILTIIGQVGCLFVLAGWPWRASRLKSVYDFLGDIALPGAFLVVVGAMFGSLYFSEVAKFPPCELCWYQRIIMYPQVVLLGLALLKKNRDVISQLFVLNGLGLLISLYQTYLQYGGSALVPCSTTGLAVSCAQRNFLEFGYITIPVMAVTGFAMILVATIVHRHAEKTSVANTTE